MAKRPRFSRWRRLPGVFRTGDRRPPDSGTELDRIILYVPARILDLAEALAEKSGAGSVQDYCALLLMQSLEIERVQKRVAEFETRHGPLEGLKEIARDPRYLAEWQRRSDARSEAPDSAAQEEPGRRRAPVSGEPATVDVFVPEREVRVPDPPVERVVTPSNDEKPGVDPVQIRIEPPSSFAPIVTLRSMEHLPSEGSPSEILLRHVRSAEDEWGFLPCLRRGEPVPIVKAAELNRALRQLEDELGGAGTVSRSTAIALHHLALESQILLTDAWPGRFDERMIAAIRTVQEAVERILSGQDIRYYASPVEPDGERPN